MQKAINTTPFHFSEQNENTTHALPSLSVCVEYTHIHTHSYTTMPTCLSIRFYHHRDTVDSSFVCPEKIGAVQFQNHHIHLDLQRLWVCICMCFGVPAAHREKGQGCELHVGQKSSVFVSACLDMRFMLLVQYDLLNTLRSLGVVFQKKKGVKY